LPESVKLGQTSHMADLLNIKVDVDGPLAACKELRENQIPFTIARALTMTAIEARDAVRVEEKRVFHTRNDWTTSRTLVKMATKQDLTAQVYTDTANRKTGAPDYLPRQEEGGIKRPSGYGVQFQGGSYLAVPTKVLLRMIGGGIMPAKYRPTNMLLSATLGPPTKGQMRRRRAQLREGMYYFIVTFKSGKLGVMGRNANDARDAAVPLYILTPDAHVTARFPMDQTVKDVVEQSFSGNFSKAAIEVMGNDLLRGSGVSVRL